MKVLEKNADATSGKMKAQGDFVPAEESSLTHILGHRAHGYGIISASRSKKDKKGVVKSLMNWCGRSARRNQTGTASDKLKFHIGFHRF